MTPEKLETYESGRRMIGPPYVQFNFRYYFFALLFLLFDVEALFLFPWAVALRRLELFGFIEMLVFLIILGVGLLYAWRKKALEWV
ncbi:MAG: NAD(P)H-quinone oxidoreductase subunit 3 [Dehalococcoidia bacterium]|nr:NAD(P)H-quinone oxidoreductase subunit 3 [Dehalococcoidia bacterium]